MNKTKTMIAVISAAALVTVAVTGIWYCKNRLLVPDKNGMIFSLTDTISSCQYELSGGMNGELTEAQIYLKDNGEVWIKYHYSYPVGTDKEDITLEHKTDAGVIEDIREICKKYGVLGWGKLKISDIKILDGATEKIALVYSEKQYYSFNSGLNLPEGGEEIFREIEAIINQCK